MLEITAIDHIVLRTTNLEAMLKFYIEVLGCRIERETPRETGGGARFAPFHPWRNGQRF